MISNYFDKTIKSEGKLITKFIKLFPFHIKKENTDEIIDNLPIMISSKQ